MKLRTHLAVAAMLLTFGFSSAEASPISFDYNFEPSPVFVKNNGGVCTGDTSTSTVSGIAHEGCKSLSYAYALEGYDALTDTLTSAWLTLTFRDDDDGHAEQVIVSLDGAVVFTSLSSGSAFPSDPFDVVTHLEADGQLSVMLSRPSGSGNNDFYFLGSRLTAEGLRDDGPTPLPESVPEPATLALLGAGLVAVARRCRKGGNANC